ENIASYCAGGLEAGECGRVEQHTASCKTCARALVEARDVERGLESLFASVRPDPALEDRVINSLRAAPTVSIPMYVRITGAAAAAVLLAGIGAAMSNFAVRGGLPFPEATSARILRETEEERKDALRQVGL